MFDDFRDTKLSFFVVFRRIFAEFRTVVRTFPCSVATVALVLPSTMTVATGAVFTGTCGGLTFSVEECAPLFSACQLLVDIHNSGFLLTRSHRNSTHVVIP